MNRVSKIFLILCGFIFALLLPSFSVRAENIIVVIDPGHGGENLGGHTDDYIEQELTLKVAKAMKDRLEQYEGIDVYLTHDEIGTKDLSRSRRAEIAAEYDADFLFSLHFNMSENHSLFGSEVWTSAFGKYYSAGQEFAHIEMDALVNELGFFDRGVKTRLGKTGDDYYGIIQAGKKRGIPTVIIEHCHMDEERDYRFLENEPEPYVRLGNIDADCVAKYFRLKSESLGLDFSDYERDIFEPIEKANGLDLTEPEQCSLELVSVDMDSNKALLRLTARDSDSPMQYYCFSYDEGKTFGRLLPWNEDIDSNVKAETDCLELYVDLDIEGETRLMAQAFNQFDLYTSSEVIVLPQGEEKIEEVPIAEEVSVPKIESEEIKENTYSSEMLKFILAGVIAIAAIVTLAFFLLIILPERERRKRRNRRRKRKR